MADVDIYSTVGLTLSIILFLVLIIGAIAFWNWFTNAVNEMNAHLERIEYLLEFLTDQLVEEDTKETKIEEKY